MKFTEYMGLLNHRPELSETSLERFYRLVNSGSADITGFPYRQYPVFKTGNTKILGLTEVFDSLAYGLQMAVTAYKQGQLTLFVITGPTGSGKTDVGKKLEDLLIADNQANPAYSFTIDNAQCPFFEQPTNLLTSRLSLVPSTVIDKFYRPGSTQLCPSCVKTYNEQLAKFGESSGQDIDAYFRMLDEFVTVRAIPPRIASADITQAGFRQSMVKVIKNANRGILHIDVNQASLGSIPAENYQALLKLGDGKILLADGTSVMPDVLVVLYTNWSQDELKSADRRPFADRTYWVGMRWNLSWRFETEIYRKMDFPFEHTSRAALDSLAMAIVSSRLKDDIAKRNIVYNKETDVRAAERWLRLYSLFEEANPGMNDQERDELLKRLASDSDGRFPAGLSVRQGMKKVAAIKPGNSACLSPQDAINWLDSNKDLVGLVSSYVGQDHAKSQCISDIVLAHIYERIEVRKPEDIDKVEQLFKQYFGILAQSSMQSLSYVQYNGRKISPEEALTDLEGKLGVVKSKSKDFRKAISDFMDQSVPKRAPTFKDVLDMDPSIITTALKEDTYLPWEKIRKRESMTEVEQERIDGIRGMLIQFMGYCTVCVDDAMQIAARSR